MSPIEKMKKIKEYDHQGLLNLWDKVIITDGKMANWDRGSAFEYLIIRAFELEGAEVTYPFQISNSVNFQARKDINKEWIVEELDGAIYFKHYNVIIESKARKSTVNVEPIAKLRNQLLNRPNVGFGVVFSISGFTVPAVLNTVFMRQQSVLLWTGNEVLEALKRKKMCEFLEKKFRASFEQLMPDFNPAVDYLS